MTHFKPDAAVVTVGAAFVASLLLVDLAQAEGDTFQPSVKIAVFPGSLVLDEDQSLHAEWVCIGVFCADSGPELQATIMDAGRMTPHARHSHMTLADVPPPRSCTFNDTGQPSCAPGDWDEDSREVLCAPGGTQSGRYHPSQAVRRRMYEAYSIEWPTEDDFEIDHRVAESLGGAQTIANLYPQRSPDYHEKDAVEAELHRRYCKGDISLEAARAILLGAWRAYLRAMKAGKPK
jgi:hypothetical protein